MSTNRVELSAECQTCRLEGGVIEVYDALVAACRFGLPAETRCRLCRAATRSTFDGKPTRSLADIPANRCPGCEAELTPIAIDERCCPMCGARATVEQTSHAISFTRSEVERSLDDWATAEDFPTREALLEATFVNPHLASLLTALAKGDPIEIVADPFANLGVRTSSQRMEAAKPSPSPPAPAPPPAPDPSPSSAPRSAPPRAIVYPLVSVIAADGEIHPAERALVDRFLQSEGLSPLTNDEFRVHHPSEVAHLVPRERREDVVKLMCESAAVDGMPDESERRVIRAYANAWHVDDEKVEFWLWGYETMNTSLTRQLWLKLRRFVLSARWADDES